MAKTFEELKAQANQIKNETAKGANTAQRVGQMLLDIIDRIEECKCICDVEQPKTDISVLFQATEDEQVIANAVCLKSGIAGGRAKVQWDESEDFEDLAVGTGLTYFNHTYQSAGAHTVRILAWSEITDVRFSTTIPQAEDHESPVDTEFLAGINYVKSSTLTNLNYMFAGQKNLTSIPDGFSFETPAVTVMIGTFLNCSSLITLPKQTLWLMPNIIWLFWTFSGIKIQAIDADFFMCQTALLKTVDLFRNCSSLSTQASIPAGLLRNCRSLWGLEGFFNNCGWLPSIPQAFLEGTSAQNCAYMCWLCTRLSPPDNVLQYTKNSVTNVEGMFGQLFWSNKDINAIFPDASYSQITTVASLFSNSQYPDAPNSFTGDGTAFVAKFPNAAQTAGALAGLSKLTNWESVPSSWK